MMMLTYPTGASASTPRLGTRALGNAADKLILYLILAQIFILEFLGFGRYTNWVLLALILVRLALSGWRLFDVPTVPLLTFLTVILLLGWALGGLPSISQSNALMVVYPAMYSLYLYLLCVNRRGYLESFVAHVTPLLNVALIVNLAAMVEQLNSPGSIVAYHAASQEIPFYEDTVSGFFAYASTHTVALYTTLVLLMNIAAVRRRKTRGLSVTPLRIYNVALVIASFGVASLNDNKALFVVLPMVLLVLLFGDMATGRLRPSAALVGALLAAILLVLAYALVPAFQIFVTDQYSSLFEMAASSRDIGSSANGSNERIAILAYALGMQSTWGVGLGIGASGLYAAGFLGFHHFGQADMGSFLVLFGIWFVMAYLWLFVRESSAPLCDGGPRRRTVLYLLLACIALMAMIYTQPFSNVDECVCLFLTCFGLSCMWAESARTASTKDGRGSSNIEQI